MCSKIKILILFVIQNFKTMVIDFDQVHAQTPIFIDVCLFPPLGFAADNDFILKLHKNITCFKQGR